MIAWSWEFLEAGQSLGWPSLEKDGARVGKYEKQLLSMAIVCLGQLVTSNQCDTRICMDMLFI